MKPLKDKAALFDRLQREKAYWEALLQVVSEDDMLMPGVTGDWTFKDVVAHLTAWRKRTVARLAGAQLGGAPLPPEWPAELGEDVQPINAWVYRQNRDRPLTEVLAESRQVWQQLVDVVAALPEDVSAGPRTFCVAGGRRARACGLERLVPASPRACGPDRRLARAFARLKVRRRATGSAKGAEPRGARGTRSPQRRPWQAWAAENPRPGHPPENLRWLAWTGRHSGSERRSPRAIQVCLTFWE